MGYALRASAIFSRIHSVLGSLLDAIYPQKLPTALSLLSRIDPVRLEGEMLRKRGITSLDRLVAAASYREVEIRQMVHVFKYSRMRERSGELAACLLPCLHFLSSIPPPVLCPVPLHWTRRLFRGFNQSAELAAILGREEGLEVRQLLRRTRTGPAQVGLSAALRRRNVQQVFRCVGAPPLCIVLVDDVATTGATLDACAQALKDAGAERVEALVVALG